MAETAVPEAPRGSREAELERAIQLLGTLDARGHDDGRTVYEIPSRRNLLPPAAQDIYAKGYRTERTRRGMVTG